MINLLNRIYSNYGKILSHACFFITLIAIPMGVYGIVNDSSVPKDYILLGLMVPGFLISGFDLLIRRYKNGITTHIGEIKE